MKLKPLHDWAVIKRLNAEEKTAGGIIIPDVAKERPSEGVVISIGPGKYTVEKGRLKFTPTTIKPGQRIFYSEYSATDAELDGREFTLVREEDILGTFEEGGIKTSSKKEIARNKKAASKTVASSSKARTKKTAKKKSSKTAKKAVKKPVLKSFKKAVTKKKVQVKRKKQAGK